jgi:hypothetical protein
MDRLVVTPPELLRIELTVASPHSHNGIPVLQVDGHKTYGPADFVPELDMTAGDFVKTKFLASREVELFLSQLA